MESLYELSVLKETEHGAAWDNLYFKIGEAGKPEIITHIPNSEYVVYIPALGSQLPLNSKLRKLTEKEAKKFLDDLSRDFSH